MFERKQTQKFKFILCAGIGVCGAIGQSYILYHELVRSYPFKMMGMPPDWFYTAIGNIGLYISPVIAALSAVLAKRKKGWIIASLPVIVCPLVFLLLFESAFLFSPYHGDLMHQSNFEGYTGETARYAFGFQVLGLLIFGSLIGFVSGYFIERLSSICEKQLV